MVTVVVGDVVTRVVVPEVDVAVNFVTVVVICVVLIVVVREAVEVDVVVLIMSFVLVVIITSAGPTFNAFGRGVP